ncbi:hypothetical protein MMC26_006338 [Xylographa opegraphella]|nr:hypothetical protein [Xylographa opegraphella]
MSNKGRKRGSVLEGRPLSPPPVKRKIASTTTKKAVATFFTPTSKKDPDRITWRIISGTLIHGKHKPKSDNILECRGHSNKKRKVAAFDFVSRHDSTLIRTSSGNVFGRNAADWQWWDPCVPGKLRKLYEDGYLVVILSNQGGISLRSDSKTAKADQKSLTQFKLKLSHVFEHFDFPISIYAATARDQYRKPRIGMWKELLEDHDLDEGDGPDLRSSIFVGDAAGRGGKGGVKEDHSSSDRGFASNIGISFMTPEEYFLGEEPQPFQHTFDPKIYLDNDPNSLQLGEKTSPAQSLIQGTSVEFEKINKLDIVIFCGSPGAGKSTFYWNKLQPLGYERVNQDSLKTRDRCLKVAFDHLSFGRSVAVDNTNADPATRASWVELAQKVGVPVRCILFTATTKLCEHNDTVRALNIGALNPERRTILPHSAFSSYAARFVLPGLEEGFQDIVTVPFRLADDNDLREIWMLYWI